MKPVQKPYPPLWFPSSNKESVEFTARHGYHTAFLGTARAVQAALRPLPEDSGRSIAATPARHNAPCGVAATSPRHSISSSPRRREARGDRARGVREVGVPHPPPHPQARPPRRAQERPVRSRLGAPLITGSPRTALDKLQEVLDVTSANYLLCVFSFGDMAPEHALRSLELFRARSDAATSPVRRYLNSQNQGFPCTQGNVGEITRSDDKMTRGAAIPARMPAVPHDITTFPEHRSRAKKRAGPLDLPSGSDPSFGESDGDYTQFGATVDRPGCSRSLGRRW